MLGQTNMAPPVATAQQPAPMLQISPQVTDALQKIAGGFSGMGGGFNPAMMDKNSPEYKQAMMMELAKQGNGTGAVGSMMMQAADAFKQNKAQNGPAPDPNSWAPTINYGG